MTQPAAPTALDRILLAFRRLVRAEDPNRTYGFGPWEYQVDSADGSALWGNPTSTEFPLPPMVGWPYRPALAGTTCVPTRGTLAYVAFANADPTKPIVVGFGPCPPASGPSPAQPTAIRIDADKVTVGDPGGSPQPVARVGDSAAGGTLVLSAGAQTLTYTPPGGGIPVVSPPATIALSALISSGSTKLQSE